MKIDKRLRSLMSDEDLAEFDEFFHDISSIPPEESSIFSFHEAIYEKADKRTLEQTAIMHYWAIRDRAKRKGIKFSLPVQWVIDAYIGGICHRTGIKFSTELRSPFLPSVDRIDPSLGYVSENCQVVCLIYNFCKNQYTDDVVLEFAKALVENNRKAPTGIQARI